MRLYGHDLDALLVFLLFLFAFVVFAVVCALCVFVLFACLLACWFLFARGLRLLIFSL